MNLRDILFKHNETAVGAKLGVYHFTPRERQWRALQALLGCWVLAVLAIAIPVAHFILVPGLLIAGVMLALQRLKGESALGSAEGVCPACQQSIALTLAPNDQLPKWTYCPLCRAPLQVAPAEREQELSLVK